MLDRQTESEPVSRYRWHFVEWLKDTPKLLDAKKLATDSKRFQSLERPGQDPVAWCRVKRGVSRVRQDRISTSWYLMRLKMGKC